jgi:hypothetical protein
MDAELVSLVSDIAIGVAAAIVAVVGLVGLRTWKEELTGRAKFEVSRNVMLLAFKLKAGFGWATSPFTSSGEFVDRPHGENESQAETTVLDEWHARHRRLKPLVEDLQKLQTAGWEAEILLDEDSRKSVSEAIEIFRRNYAELATAIESYFEVSYKEANGTSVNTDRDWLEKLRKIIYSMPGSSLLEQIDEATAQLASTLKAYVK